MTLSRPQKASSTVNGADDGSGWLFCHLGLEKGRERKGKRGQGRAGEERDVCLHILSLPLYMPRRQSKRYNRAEAKSHLFSPLFQKIIPRVVMVGIMLKLALTRHYVPSTVLRSLHLFSDTVLKITQ